MPLRARGRGGAGLPSGSVNFAASGERGELASSPPACCSSPPEPDPEDPELVEGPDPDEDEDCVEDDDDPGVPLEDPPPLELS